MIRGMELFALLQVTGGPGNVSAAVSAVNVLVFGVFVGVVVTTVLLMSINRKMKDVRRAMVEMAQQAKDLPSNS
jgi:hypothetical protein